MPSLIDVMRQLRDKVFQFVDRNSFSELQNHPLLESLSNQAKATHGAPKSYDLIVGARDQGACPGRVPHKRAPPSWLPGDLSQALRQISSF
jgi:hypothetical protein